MPAKGRLIVVKAWIGDKCCQWCFFKESKNKKRVKSNWNAAMQEQGFTPNAQDLPTLSTQRIWYDKASPAFGEGN